MDAQMEKRAADGVEEAYSLKCRHGTQVRGPAEAVMCQTRHRGNPVATVAHLDV